MSCLDTTGPKTQCEAVRGRVRFIGITFVIYPGFNPEATIKTARDNNAVLVVWDDAPRLLELKRNANKAAIAIIRELNAVTAESPILRKEPQPWSKRAKYSRKF